MKLLRTIPWFTRLLVGLFLAAQLAGMASSPRANALPMAVSHLCHGEAAHADGSASQGRHHDMQSPSTEARSPQAHPGHDAPCGHHDHGGGFGDACCALHACFAGLLPLTAAVAVGTAAGEPLGARPDEGIPGARGGRLDRPPRPLH